MRAILSALAGTFLGSTVSFASSLDNIIYSVPRSDETTSYGIMIYQQELDDVESNDIGVTVLFVDEATGKVGSKFLPHYEITPVLKSKLEAEPQLFGYGLRDQWTLDTTKEAADYIQYISDSIVSVDKENKKAAFQSSKDPELAKSLLNKIKAQIKSH